MNLRLSKIIAGAKNENHATAIEYGLIATLIAVAIIIGATALGTKLNDVFNGSQPSAPATTPAN